MMVREHLLELIVATSIVLLGLIIGWGAMSMPFGTAALPGPGFFPSALSVLLCGTGVLLMLRPLRNWASSQDQVLLTNKNGLVAMGALFAISFLFEPLGYFLATTLFLWILLWQWSPLNFLRAGIAAAASTFLLQLFFSDLLGVQLPSAPFMLFGAS